MSNKEIEELVEEAYSLNLQNLNDRLTENESFREGIEIGIRELLEKQKEVNCTTCKWSKSEDRLAPCPICNSDFDMYEKK